MDHERLYSFRFRQVDQERRAAVWDAVSSYLYRRLGEPERILDPAAGRCEFIDRVPAKERWGIDMTEQAIELRPGTKLLVANVMEAEVPESYFDAVFVSNFLEHLDSQEEINEFLVKMLGALKPGGRIAVMGPNVRYCGTEYWDFADHKIPLSHLAIEEHLYTAGFEPTETEARFLPYSFTGRLPASRGLTSAYLKFRPAWRLLGKQFLVIGVRP